MFCAWHGLSVDIAVKYPVSRHPLPDPPSWTPEGYEATSYCLVENILPPDLVDELCALQLEGEETWEDILLRGHNQGGGRRQTALGTVNRWLCPELKWRLPHILADLFPVLDGLGHRESRLVEQMEAPMDDLLMAAPQLHAYLAGCRRHDDPACAQWCIFSIVRANVEKYDLCSAPIARALPRYIVVFFKFFKTGKCFKTMLFPVSCVSQNPLAFQKHSLLLTQPKTHAKTLSERSEKCATV